MRALRWRAARMGTVSQRASQAMNASAGGLCRDGRQSDADGSAPAGAQAAAMRRNRPRRPACILAIAALGTGLAGCAGPVAASRPTSRWRILTSTCNALGNQETAWGMTDGNDRKTTAKGCSPGGRGRGFPHKPEFRLAGPSGAVDWVKLNRDAGRGLTKPAIRPYDSCTIRPEVDRHGGSPNNARREL